MNDSNLERFKYDDALSKLFIYATVIWGFVALFLGVTVAFQLASWKVNLGMEWNGLLLVD